MIPKTTVDRIIAKILRLYVRAAKSIVQTSVAAGAVATEDRQFNFRDFPGLEKQVDKIVRELSADSVRVILKGEETSWLLSAQTNLALINSLFSGDVPKILSERFVGRNIQGLRAFQQRTTNGLNLSDRIWNYTKTFEKDAKIVLDNGLLSGRSAADIADSLVRHVKNPTVAFEEFRDNRGKIQLSKEADHYHPGQGRYRSSFKNAERVARTEINNAYRKADNLAWDSMPFVVGYNVVRSNNPYPCVRCETLKGRYPKSFRFSGWHPQCRCAAIPIIVTDEEFEEINERILDGDEVLTYKSVNSVTKVPKQYTDYVKKNEAGVKDTWWFKENKR